MEYTFFPEIAVIKGPGLYGICRVYFLWLFFIPRGLPVLEVSLYMKKGEKENTSGRERASFVSFVLLCVRDV